MRDDAQNEDDHKSPAPVLTARRKPTNPQEQLEAAGRATLEDDGLDRHRHV